MEESLRFAGYDVNHAWGVLGHEGSTASSCFPEAIKWLWRDYPKPIVAGVSGNDWLKDVLVVGETWHPLDQVNATAVAVASDPAGSVYFADPAGVIYKLDDSGKAAVYAKSGAPVSSMAFGGDGSLMVVQPDAQKILKLTADGHKSVALSGIRASHVIVDSKGRLYVSEPGLHDELPSSVWLVADGKKTLIDSGIRDATGLLISPDRTRLVIAEAHTRWLFDSLLQPDGTIQFREHYYWLHVDEVTTDGDWTDASDLAMDVNEHLFAATRMGVQVGDNEGRIAGILTLPSGPVRSLTFGGKAFDTLYVVSGGKIFKRTMLHPTVPSFVAVPGANSPAPAK